MPIYEYVCSKCHSRFSILVRTVNGSIDTTCTRCGSAETSRAVSTFSYHKSQNTIHEESGEPSILSGSDYYKDPRNIGRWTEKKFEDMGMDMPSEISEQIEAARDGQLPESLTEG